MLKSTNGGDAFSDTFFTRTTDGAGAPNKNIRTGYEGTGGDSVSAEKYQMRSPPPSGSA